MMRTFLSRHWTALLLGAGIFLLATALRLPYIHSFLTADEINGASMASKFLMGLIHHDWAETITLGYPSVTTSWLTILGVVLQWLFARPEQFASFGDLAAYFQAHPLDMDILAWGRVGMILFAAGSTVAIWWLTRRLLGDRVALLATALLLFDPILLGYTRLVNPNPPLIHLLVITWLSLLLAVREDQRRLFLFSGAAFGLAVLAKTPALSLGPLIVVWMAWHRWEKREQRSWLGATLRDLLWFGIPAIATIWLLWPSLWVNPIGTMQRVWKFTFAMGAHSHELGNFWLGEPRDPGILLYPAAYLWRTTPVVFIGSILAVIAFFKARSLPHRRTIGALFILIIWYGVVLTLSPKRFDRYLFPTFPAIDILAAWGWLWLLDTALARRFSARWATIAAAVLIFFQAAFALVHLPTYLTAYNPLVGGVRTASRVMMVGWGEGLEEAARFLNNQPDNQPDANQKRTASWYGYNVFEPFYAGQTSALFYGIDSAEDAYKEDIDYIVTYINQLQRQLLDESIQSRLSQPLMTSGWNGVTYASVYAWPKPFAHTIERQLGPGLTLLGWEVQPFDPASGELNVTLFWDSNQMEGTSPPPIHLWMKDAVGDVWAQTETGETPDPTQRVSGWLDRPAVQQTLLLKPPPGLMPGPYRLEVAAEGGESFLLETMDVPPTKAALVVDLHAQPIADDVVFADTFALVGYETGRSEQALILDLLWEARAEPLAGIKYFVHVTDADDVIVAQHDGDLGALPGHPPAAWQADDLLRQRASIPLPDTVSPDLRVFVGLYRAADGQRLPLTVNAAPVPDGRYLLIENLAASE